MYPPSANTKPDDCLPVTSDTIITSYKESVSVAEDNGDPESLENPTSITILPPTQKVVEVNLSIPLHSNGSKTNESPLDAKELAAKPAKVVAGSPQQVSMNTTAPQARPGTSSIQLRLPRALSVPPSGKAPYTHPFSHVKTVFYPEKSAQVPKEKRLGSQQFEVRNGPTITTEAKLKPHGDFKRQIRQLDLHPFIDSSFLHDQSVTQHLQKTDGRSLGSKTHTLKTVTFLRSHRPLSATKNPITRYARLNVIIFHELTPVIDIDPSYTAVQSQ
jgi:hypothetical protein